MCSIHARPCEWSRGRDRESTLVLCGLELPIDYPTSQEQAIKVRIKIESHGVAGEVLCVVRLVRVGRGVLWQPPAPRWGPLEP